MTTNGEPTIEAVGLGWPIEAASVSRETIGDVSRETNLGTTPAVSVGLGWPA